jgi:hypothetical protein
MFHPHREVLARSVQLQLGEARVALVPDPDPDGVPSPLRTAARAWELVSRGSLPWVFVCQDDIEVSEAAIESLDQAFESTDFSAIALYVNAQSRHNGFRARLAALASFRFVELHPLEYVPTQFLGMKTSVLRDVLPTLQEMSTTRVEDDDAIRDVLFGSNNTVGALLPNLVEHRMDVPSLMKESNVGDRVTAVPRGVVTGGLGVLHETAIHELTHGWTPVIRPDEGFYWERLRSANRVRERTKVRYDEIAPYDLEQLSSAAYEYSDKLEPGSWWWSISCAGYALGALAAELAGAISLPAAAAIAGAWARSLPRTDDDRELLITRLQESIVAGGVVK